tara:strand:- start:10229 stop:10930 length:702 start_codon:yes stop_codon:yes gene_type:complete
MSDATAPVIALDGPGGSGKGTVGYKLAEKLNWHFLDSGSLYRILAFVANSKKLFTKDTDLENAVNIDAICKEALNFNLKFNSKILLDNKDITNVIRTEQIGNLASKIAVVPQIRQALLESQRVFQKQPGLVADGRDMGTVVFPDASLKIYLTASAEVRAKRRLLQLQGAGIHVSLAELICEIKARDDRDSNRIAAPLKPAKDAVIIDNSNLSINQVLEVALRHYSKVFSTSSI